MNRKMRRSGRRFAIVWQLACCERNECNDDGATTMAKTVCPITHAQFHTNAAPLTMVLLDRENREVFRTIFRLRELACQTRDAGEGKDKKKVPIPGTGSVSI